MFYISLGLDLVLSLFSYVHHFGYRLMAGVRRWIGNQAPFNNDVVRKSMNSTNMDTESQTHNKAETHTQTTGVLASQLLNPQVSQEELLEYHRQAYFTYIEMI